jgi:hypothetical protein
MAESQNNQLRFVVTETHIGLRVEGTVDLDQSLVTSKGNYLRTMAEDECDWWTHFSCWLSETAKKGVHARLGRFSFDVEKVRGGKQIEEAPLPTKVTDWLEKESTEILLHRLACPRTSENKVTTTAVEEKKSMSLSVSCGSSVNNTSFVVSKSRLTSYNFRGH